MKPTAITGEPTWEAALDWSMRVRAAPDDPAVARGLDEWLALAPAHAAAYRRAERVWELTGAVAPAFPPPTAVPLSPRRIGWSLPAMAIAASLLLAISPGLRRACLNDFSTGTGETRPVALVDGSTVTLDAESAMNADLSATIRAVTLTSGRAFFQVARDAARPFTVTAGQVGVTVTGTAFDVRNSASGVELAVASGTVIVTLKSDDGPNPRRRLLKPGDRVRVGRRDGTVVTDMVPADQVGLWRSGRLVVNGATVAEVVEELRRRHDGLILLNDEKLAARRVTGVFDLSDPAAALDAALRPHGAHVTRPFPLVLMAEPGTKPR